jgi:hypothetical protein
VLLHWVGGAFLFLAFASVDAHNLLFVLLQCFKILGLQFITIVINKDDFSPEAFTHASQYVLSKGEHHGLSILGCTYL